jgi:hypothetical protein
VADRRPALHGESTPEPSADRLVAGHRHGVGLNQVYLGRPSIERYCGPIWGLRRYWRAILVSWWCSIRRKTLLTC